MFRNLDLERTIWKNLTNWSPEDERLYVDRLFYRQTAKRTTPARLIVVVDQSGSMVDSMVNCTILASIFAGLPKVDVHLIAYDTRALDLTPWVHDPFEVLLRTNLGGGNDGTGRDGPGPAEDRRPAQHRRWSGSRTSTSSTASQPLFDGIEAVHRSGVQFIPVGSVNSSGSQSVNPWFRQRFKDLGTPGASPATSASSSSSSRTSSPRRTASMTEHAARPRRGQVRRGAGLAGVDRRRPEAVLLAAEPDDGAPVRPRLASAPTASTARSPRSGSATAASSSAAIVTLASDRGLLLIGDPGTGKSWLAELLAAAISRNSTLVVQGTAGTTEDHIKYSWNVSMVIAKGQSRDSMIPSPIMTAMERRRRSAGSRS